AWAQKFSGLLDGASHAPGSNGYSPSWCAGAGWSTLGAAGFASSLGGSFPSGVLSSATAPRSSSGGGAGGGGCGGGGGGRGGRRRLVTNSKAEGRRSFRVDSVEPSKPRVRRASPLRAKIRHGSCRARR